MLSTITDKTKNDASSSCEFFYPELFMEIIIKILVLWFQILLSTCHCWESWVIWKLWYFEKNNFLVASVLLIFMFGGIPMVQVHTLGRCFYQLYISISNHLSISQNSDTDPFSKDCLKINESSMLAIPKVKIKSSIYEGGKGIILNIKCCQHLKM